MTLAFSQRPFVILPDEGLTSHRRFYCIKLDVRMISIPVTPLSSVILNNLRQKPRLEEVIIERPASRHNLWTQHAKPLSLKELLWIGSQSRLFSLQIKYAASYSSGQHSWRTEYRKLPFKYVCLLLFSAVADSISSQHLRYNMSPNVSLLDRVFNSRWTTL
jgi:hypothetical protein